MRNTSPATHASSPLLPKIQSNGKTVSKNYRKEAASCLILSICGVIFLIFLGHILISQSILIRFDPKRSTTAGLACYSAAAAYALIGMAMATIVCVCPSQKDNSGGEFVRQRDEIRPLVSVIQRKMSSSLSSLGIGQSIPFPVYPQYSTPTTRATSDRSPLSISTSRTSSPYSPHEQSLKSQSYNRPLDTSFAEGSPTRVPTSTPTATTVSRLTTTAGTAVMRPKSGSGDLKDRTKNRGMPRADRPNQLRIMSRRDGDIMIPAISKRDVEIRTPMLPKGDRMARGISRRDGSMLRNLSSFQEEEMMTRYSSEDMLMMVGDTEMSRREIIREISRRDGDMSRGFSTKRDGDVSRGLSSRVEGGMSRGFSTMRDIDMSRGVSLKVEGGMSRGFSTKGDGDMSRGYSSKKDGDMNRGFSTKRDVHMSRGFSSKVEGGMSRGFSSKRDGDMSRASAALTSRDSTVMGTSSSDSSQSFTGLDNPRHYHNSDHHLRRDTIKLAPGLSRRGLSVSLLKENDGSVRTETLSSRKRSRGDMRLSSSRNPERRSTTVFRLDEEHGCEAKTSFPYLNETSFESLNSQVMPAGESGAAGRKKVGAENSRGRERPRDEMTLKRPSLLIDRSLSSSSEGRRDNKTCSLIGKGIPTDKSTAAAAPAVIGFNADHILKSFESRLSSSRLGDEILRQSLESHHHDHPRRRRLSNPFARFRDCPPDATHSTHHR